MTFVIPFQLICLSMIFSENRFPLFGIALPLVDQRATTCGARTGFESDR